MRFDQRPQNPSSHVLKQKLINDLVVEAGNVVIDVSGVPHPHSRIVLLALIVKSQRGS